jgi:hypothetical protein
MMSMVKEKLWTWSMLRYVLVLLTLGVITFDYFLFSHQIHKPFKFTPSQGENSNGNHGEDYHGEDHHGEDHHDHGHEHGRGGSFDNIHLKLDGLFLYGLALPLVLLTLASLLWNPSTSTKKKTDAKGVPADKKKSNIGGGDVNVNKWTLICFVLPLFLVMLDGARGHDVFHSSSTDQHFGWNLYIRICMSLMSPSGYAATWALSLFLIPVTKHSPILDWLRITPIQALAFHRIAGWTSFWNSVLHGFLHLRHLMDVLNPKRVRPWYEQLKILLIPNTWKCFGTQNPFTVFADRQDPYDGTNEEAQQCWLALVNATGMISVIAFVFLAITSLPQIRRYSYTLFYRVHIPSAWIMLIMAIWHYPTCALVLIPNIIYYLSFNIPVYVTQNMDNWRLKGRSTKSDPKSKSSPLLEANLIEGGSIELVFATSPKDCPRHESRFARLFCPSICPLSHPFSIFSRCDLIAGTGEENGDNSSLETMSMLLRPSGPFTEKLTKALFTNDGRNTEEATIENLEELQSSISRPLIAPPSPSCMIQVDSYYAGSFDWTDRAMSTHDEILLVAGGVGIVPFLEFLPSLQQRILMDTASSDTTGSNESPVDSEALLESANTRFGPNKIHLHWYCREIGLASYVWNRHLRHHVEEAWESNSACQGRLKIHLHLTSKDPTTGGEEIFDSVSNTGLVEKQTYPADNQNGAFSPVQDASFTQSSWIGMLLPGILITVGTILHWWWYKEFIVDEKFSHDNLVIRTHSIIFTLILALVVSIPMEHYLRYQETKAQTRRNTISDVDSAAESFSEEPEVMSTTTSNLETNIQSRSDPALDANGDPLLVVSGGRPSIESVISDVIKSDRPGVYSCGPRRLMESVESAIRKNHSDYALYREDSEM